jgi:diadenosine tetraphosphatase ApaH/serine/threonine PP2A family protein phosphatase
MADTKYAILGDIHGNSEALGAVLEDAGTEGVTHWTSVGDIVGYNADPATCLKRIRELGVVGVRGNHDHYCSHDECIRDFHPLAANVVDWTRHQLDEGDVAYLRELKLVRVVDGFTLVHSTLDMPEKWGYVFDELEAESNFNYQSTAVCFHGHTHQPAVFEKAGRVQRLSGTQVSVVLGKKYFINVGSVGQPRDGDPRASYATYDVASRTVELRRVEYDVAAAQRKILAAGLPERLAVRLALGV